jgi:hypothetical protein
MHAVMFIAAGTWRGSGRAQVAPAVAGKMPARQARMGKRGGTSAFHAVPNITNIERLLKV